MSPDALLRKCADVIGNTDVPAHRMRVTLVHIDGTGRFPFSGGDTELLNAHDGKRVYSVAVHRVLSHMAQWLKASSTEQQSGEST